MAKTIPLDPVCSRTSNDQFVAPQQAQVRTLPFEADCRYVSGPQTVTPEIAGGN